MKQWDIDTDFLVVGSGGGGLTAALTAQHHGLETLLIEKSEFIGGSTALSGGGIWIPNNPLMAQAGITDTLEKARLYLDHTVGKRTSNFRQEAYLQFAPQMLNFLHEQTHARFMITPNYADYFPELPGGMPGGRSLEPQPFNSKQLGVMVSQVRPSNIQPPLGLGLTAYEARNLYMLLRALPALWVGGKMFLANLLIMASGGRRWALGRALIGRLLLSAAERGISIWPHTAARELLIKDRRVEGVLAEREGKMIHIHAHKGVLLAAGGFEHNQEMRETYLPQPTNAKWSAGNPANMGDAIRMGLAAGAAVDLMEDAWWTPVSLPPGQPAMIHIGERSFPRQVIIDSSGKRFINESAPYHQIGQIIYAQNSHEARTIPAFLIFDQRFRSRYIFGQTLPLYTPQHFIKSEYFKRENTLEGLAKQIGVNPQNLAETIERFNTFSKEGKDTEFGRGESLYDRYYGDPSARPNPCLGPINTPPYYAVALYPGDLGTKGGLLSDEKARVLRPDGSAIDNLYACGNTSASVMGTTYPGAGSTIGPAMTFGYLAALDAVTNNTVIASKRSGANNLDF